MHTSRILLVVCALFSCSLTVVRACIPCQSNTGCQTLKHAFYGVSMQKYIMGNQDVAIEQRFLFTDDVTKLEKVKFLMEIINHMNAVQPVSQDRVSMAIDIASHITKTNSCKHLKDILASWYEGFDCSTEQLADIETRIDAYMAITELQIETLPEVLRTEFLGSFSYDEDWIDSQCKYWKQNVLKNCTVSGNSGSDTSHLQFVQELMLNNEGLCKSTQLCTFPTGLVK